MAGMTNKGAFRLIGIGYRAVTATTKFYLALVTSAVAPSDTTNVLSDLTEIAAGNGYTAGGQQVNRNATDFDVMTEDDANHRALIQLKDFGWTASGGNLPASGSGARYVLLLDDNATPASREVWNWWDLAADRMVSNGQTMTLQDMEFRIVNT